MEELAAKRILLDFEIIALITLFAGVVYWGLVRRVRAAREGPGALPPREFDRWDLVLMLFPALFFLISPLLEVAIAETALAAPRAEGEAKSPEPRADAPGLSGLLANFAYFGFVAIMTYGILEWVRDRRVVDLFGLKRLSLPAVVVYSITGGTAALVVCAWAIGNFSQGWLEGLFPELAAQGSVEAMQREQSRWHFGLSVAIACVAAPVAEEALFRGYLFGAVKDATNPLFSAVVVGALFAVVHVNLPALLPLWGFSIALSFAYLWTKCLWVPIGMHAFFNAANIVLMQLPQGTE